VIQDLKTEYSQTKNEYEEKIKFYKPNYPDMQQLKAKLDSMKTELESEIATAVEAAEADYRTALNREQSLRRLLDQQKTNVTEMNSNAILYNSLKIEVENMRGLLNTLMERQKVTLVSAQMGDLKTTNMSIIDRAEPPRIPVSPRKMRNLFLAFVLGLFGGVGLCLVLDFLDNTVKGPEDAENLVHMPSLGVVPLLSSNGLKRIKKYGYRQHYVSDEKELGEEGNQKIKNIELINHLYPSLSLSEDYRTIRTSILLACPEEPPKTIAFTSALPQEGKSATVANMAVAFSQLGLNVLVIDTDMRKPRMSRIFKTRNNRGLSGFLTGKTPFKECMLKTEIDRIWLIPSGVVPPNPNELINSQRMKNMLEQLKTGFDVILLDTPPLLAVADPVTITSLADATVLIIQSGKTTKNALLGGAEELHKGSAKVIGLVLNGVRLEQNGLYYARHYRSAYRTHQEPSQKKEGQAPTPME